MYGELFYFVRYDNDTVELVDWVSLIEKDEAMVPMCIILLLEALNTKQT